MIEKIKSVEPYQWFIGILISAFITLVTIGWTQTDKRIDSKANDKEVKALIIELKEQRKEDKQDLKEQRALDQKTNENMYKLILESIKDNKKGKSDG